MENYKPEMSFDETVAHEYLGTVRGDEAAAVSCLEKLAGNGPVLELAVGGGRIAIPLAERGIRVDGIDFSQAMLDQLKRQPGGNAVETTLGDFADVPVADKYQLIYIVWNSLFNLLKQEEQVCCFANVARHLVPGGAFLVEAYVPSYLYRLSGDQYVNAEAIEVRSVRLDLLRHDAASQTIEESHVSLSGSGIHLNPVVQRYSWPSELDLMARLAGLRLQSRWGGWNGEPFTSASELHVSTYRAEARASG